jgi:hypothetical protein
MHNGIGMTEAFYNIMSMSVLHGIIWACILYGIFIYGTCFLCLHLYFGMAWLRMIEAYANEKIQQNINWLNSLSFGSPAVFTCQTNQTWGRT